jgi:hypothetical protein
MYEYSIDPTELRLNQKYYTIYCMWMNFIFMGIGPFVALIILNSLIVLELKKIDRERALEHGGGYAG